MPERAVFRLACGSDVPRHAPECIEAAVGDGGMVLYPSITIWEDTPQALFTIALADLSTAGKVRGI